MGPKKQGFCSKINRIQMRLLYFVNWHSVRASKSAKIVLSKSIFYVKNQPNFFKKKFIEEYQFRRTFFVKNIFFLDSVFEPLYFLKLGPIFVGPTLCQFTNYSNFIWLLVIFEQKPCFLGPSREKLNDVTDISVLLLCLLWLLKHEKLRIYFTKFYVSFLRELQRVFYFVKQLSWHFLSNRKLLPCRKTKQRKLCEKKT